ncbi:VOC family protein [Piscinibacter sp.]|uniref:VOC family protein n=1 Tax=Piscinibacter sp. TaxID=1903157 RepID=UPI002CCBB6CC|nr:VOC family protein [Albitalea sp.]HUG25998.1 VOC family protein [Albitalea sp.]
MINHVSLGTNRYAESVDFYQRALAPLRMTLQRDTGAEASFGTPSQWSFYLYAVAAQEHVTERGMHLTFDAASRADVAAVHAAAMAASATDVFTPRERPGIGPTYFGAMFLDLDGHRIEVLTHVP